MKYREEKMRDRKLYPVLLFVVLFILLFNMFLALYEYLDYQKRVNSGNERWKQVETRIEEIERCCDERDS